MIDWTKSMQQTFEYYRVNPLTWKDATKLDMVKSCTINRDSEADTLGSATIDVDEMVGESYVRVYLIAVQNGETDKRPLGTFLIQTPSTSFDGKVKTVSVDAYTPLLELKENPPPIGYSLLKEENIMKSAYLICRDNMRAPVVETSSTEKLSFDFVANTDDTWITFVNDLVANAKYKLDLDEMGRVLFAPDQETESMQPVYTYTDDNSSILYPEIDMDHDIYGIPNVVEVVYSNGEDNYYARVVNDDPNSPTSTVSRGRVITYRETEPSLVGYSTEDQIKEYAEKLLKKLSSLEYTVSYSHGYCPVRVGDCVRLDYRRAGLKNIKARVISQDIKCEAGCQVSEKAVFTVKLWR